MKLSNRIFSFFLLGGILFSCGDGEKHSGDSNTELRLNNGNRWEVNGATTEGIQNMVLLVDAFELTDSQADYLELKSKLEEEFKIIFQKCDMTGEAHDQLHNYLFPLKRLFNRLKSDDVAELEQTILDLEAHLKDFHTYFR